MEGRLGTMRSWKHVEGTLGNRGTVGAMGTHGGDIGDHWGHGDAWRGCWGPQGLVEGSLGTTGTHRGAIMDRGSSSHRPPRDIGDHEELGTHGGDTGGHGVLGTMGTHGGDIWVS